MEALVSRNADGRPVITGCGTLPPEKPQSPQPKRSKKSQQATANRFAVLNAFVDCSLAGLSKAELATWLCLYRDTRQGTACTSQSDIARRSGLSIRAVGKATRKLIASGFLVVVFQGGLNRGPSRYRVESLRKQCS